MIRKKCKNCGKKIRKEFNHCPYCGRPNRNEEDWGLLGKEDFTQEFEEIPVFNSMLNSLMKSLSKNLYKKFNEFEKEISKQPVKKRGISISISSFGNGKPKIKIKHFGDDIKEKEKPKLKKLVGFSEQKAKEFASLPKEEPKTHIKRLSNKIIYEIEIPGVKKLEDISIVKLESSIEIKAIAKNKAYSKIIPLSLPIIDYNLSEDRLILELKA